MFGSTPSNSLRLLFSRILLLFSRSLLLGPPLPFLVSVKVSVLFAAGLLRSSNDRLRTVSGSLNCQDIAARATFLALREWPKETSLMHTCAIGPCRAKALLEAFHTTSWDYSKLRTDSRQQRTLDAVCMPE